MFIMLLVSSLCVLVLMATLLGAACRNPDCESIWIVSDDAILCVVAPVMIMFFGFACVALGWRLTHGGFDAVSMEGWIGSAVIIAVSVWLWFRFVGRIRDYRRKPGPT